MKSILPNRPPSRKESIDLMRGDRLDITGHGGEILIGSQSEQPMKVVGHDHESHCDGPALFGNHGSHDYSSAMEVGEKALSFVGRRSNEIGAPSLGGPAFPKVSGVGAVMSMDRRWPHGFIAAGAPLPQQGSWLAHPDPACQEVVHEGGFEDLLGLENGLVTLDGFMGSFKNRSDLYLFLQAILGGWQWNEHFA